MQKQLNKALYSNQLLPLWSQKEKLLPIEKYFIEEYLINKNGKVIEAGTGGGRIIFQMEQAGFTKLEAFDYVEKMISFCNKKKKLLKSLVNFRIEDATILNSYKDNEFDYLIYLQQVLCFVDEDLILVALKEAFRIGKKDSIYIFSFLNWNTKFYNPFLSLIVNFLRLLRFEKTNKYKLPWLKLDKKINWKFLNKNQPQNLWFEEKQIINILKNCGFSILEVKTQVNNRDKKEHIHIACKKNI